MFGTFKIAFRIRELRHKLYITIGILVLIRLISQIPVPGIRLDYFKEWYEKNSQGFLNFLSMFSGGSFKNFSLLALGITPYITASIIIQLLSVVFTELESMRKDGKYGRRKLEWINKVSAIALSFLESIAMVIGFKKTGILGSITILKFCLMIFSFTLGTAFLIVCSEWINERGIGNGISVILMANIVSELPGDIGLLYENYVLHQKASYVLLRTGIILLFVLAVSIFIILLNEGYRRISVKYSKKIHEKKAGEGYHSYIPVKVNLSGVAPVIFASSVLTFPQMMSVLIGGNKKTGIFRTLLNCLSQSSWFQKQHPEYSIGFFLYIGLILFFAFFYTSITYNAIEMAENLRKQNGCIPGIRQGKPTEHYIGKVLRCMTIIGTTGLILIIVIPILLCRFTGISISIGGTSLIIIYGVILEILDQIEAELKTHNYGGFLKEHKKKKSVFRFLLFGKKVTGKPRGEL